jgi:hypothetical protein
MTLDEQFELLTKFYKHLLIEEGVRGYLYEGRIDAITREVDFVYQITEVYVSNSTLYINDVAISNLFLTKKEAMQAVYDRLSTVKQSTADFNEVQNYNQRCFIFDLPQITINTTALTTQIEQMKVDLQSKELQLSVLATTIGYLKIKLKELEELT